MRNRGIIAPIIVNDLTGGSVDRHARSGEARDDYALPDFKRIVGPSYCLWEKKRGSRSHPFEREKCVDSWSARDT